MQRVSRGPNSGNREWNGVMKLCLVIRVVVAPHNRKRVELGGNSQVSSGRSPHLKGPGTWTRDRQNVTGLLEWH